MVVKTQQNQALSIRQLINYSLQGRPINQHIRQLHDLPDDCGIGQSEFDLYNDNFDCQVFDSNTDKLETLAYAIEKREQISQNYINQLKQIEDEKKKKNEEMPQTQIEQRRSQVLNSETNEMLTPNNDKTE